MHAIPSLSVGEVPTPLPQDLTVLDVREPVEWDNGHLPGAMHIPLMDLPARLGELPEGRLLVVCAVGARSARAVEYLLQHGHDAANLDGGLVEWQSAGHELVRD